MATASPKRQYRTRKELYDAIRAFDEGQWAKLRRIAKNMAFYDGDGKILWEDLLQEAFRRAFDGWRQCPVTLDVVPFFVGIMRSISSHQRAKLKKGQEPVLSGSIGSGDLDPASDAPSPEHQAISSVVDGATLREIERSVSGDPLLVGLLNGVYDGLRGKQLQEHLNVSEMQLGTLRHKLKVCVRKVHEKRQEPNA